MTNDNDDDFILSAYIVPQDNKIHPVRYYNKLVKLDENAHLIDGEAVFDFLLVNQPVINQGKQVIGAVHMPMVQGKLRGVFEWMLVEKLGRMPDYLMLLDNDYWCEGEDIDREILMYHEMCHCCHKEDKYGEPRFDESGRPVFGLIGHDVEEFSKTVRRYGAFSESIKEFIAAANEGDKQ